jgi:hypothetical protein
MFTPFDNGKIYMLFDNGNICTPFDNGKMFMAFDFD